MMTEFLGILTVANRSEMILCLALYLIPINPTLFTRYMGKLLLIMLSYDNTLLR